MDQPLRGGNKRTGTALLAQDVHRLLRTKIISLEFKPGSRVVEEDICRDTGVGRTPVREALLRLEGDPANARFIFEARISVEAYATRVAAERGNRETIARLRELVRGMDELDTIGRAELNRLDRTFHETIVAMSGNPLFVEMHQRTQFHYWNLRLPVFFNKEQTLRANSQHGEIVDAIEAGDGDTAERRAREHIETTYAIVRQALDGF